MSSPRRGQQLRAAQATYADRKRKKRQLKLQRWVHVDDYQRVIDLIELLWRKRK